MRATLTTLESEITACRLCPRLVAWREHVAVTKRAAYADQTYWGRPVPGFGDPDAWLLIVGLAPGAHGSNRTGRTGSANDHVSSPPSSAVPTTARSPASAIASPQSSQ